jgi:hypothetical protein
LPFFSIDFKYADTASLSLTTGRADGNVVNAWHSEIPTYLSCTGSAATVNVGNGIDGVREILGALSIYSPSFFNNTTINVGDAADNIAQNFVIGTNAFDAAWGFVHASTLPFFSIDFKYADTNTVTLNGGSGGNVFNVRGPLTGTTLSLNGGSGINTLQSPDSDTTWQITGSNAGSFTGGVSFTSMQNLTGGAGADTFVFSDGAGVSGTIDGGGGTNTLDYSAYASSNVLVNLQTAFATGVGGGIANIQNAKGATGGPAGSYNILVGNGGNVLTGGNDRRNLLIAGPTASTLIGRNGDDILIGGTTTYDSEPGMVSLQAIMAYWAGSADDYATRVSNLLNGTGVPILAPFDPTTGIGVIGNGGGNTMNGNGTLALIYSDGADNITGFDPNSIIVPITP